MQSRTLERWRLAAISAAVASLVTALVAVPAIQARSDSDESTGGALHRLAADYADFGGSETATSVTPNTTGDPADPGGIVIYEKKVRVPRGHNVLYATLSTTGDAHDGAASCFAATVDDVTFMPFNVGVEGAARCADGQRAPGWTSLLKIPAASAATNCNDGGGGTGDCHDNSIYYTWCVHLPAGSHTVKLHMGSAQSGATVFIENSHFFIDSNRIEGNPCQLAGEGADAASSSSRSSQ